MTVTQLPPGNFVQLPARPLTLDDVTYLLANDELHRFELTDGNLLVLPLPDPDHAALTTRIAAWLRSHASDPNRVRTGGALRTGASSGRTPDVVALRRPTATDWLTPSETDLVVEVVSAGTETIDRRAKPAEYARAGITHFWRVERHGPATVHRYRLGIDDHGGHAYLARPAIRLDDLLAGPPSLD